jgi:hypothetical protein
VRTCRSAAARGPEGKREPVYDEYVASRCKPVFAAILVVGAFEVGCGSSPDRVEVSANLYLCPSQSPRATSVYRMLGSSGGAPFDSRGLVGLSEQEARDKAMEYGCIMRVVRRDGRGLGRSANWESNRINVDVRDGTVIAIEDVA